MQTLDFRWIERDKPDTEGDPLAHAIYSKIVSQILYQRGFVEITETENYLHPKLKDLGDPFLLRGMQAAVERLLLAIDQKQNVCIFGDYDVDGISSISIMKRTLSAYGLDARVFIPVRGREGYGLSFAALERCLEEGVKPDLLITVDCGTASLEEVAFLNTMGIDVLIVDHHEPSEKGIPECIAVVNPKCGQYLTYLCAAAVVFKISHALLKTRKIDFELKGLLDLVAMATISDIVPLIGENRIFVRHGLHRFANSENVGIRALQKVAGIHSKPNASDLGFRIGPRINAAGRMDVPIDAYRILNTDRYEEAEELAERLNQYNRQRQALENQIFTDALREIKLNEHYSTDAVIVLGSRDWHHGVVGIVASRIMRQFHKPAFIISFDKLGMGKGSGRSIPGISLVDAIRACEDDLVKGGGHAMAAGLSIQEEKLSDFRQHFSEFVLHNSNEEDRRPRVMYDMEVEFADLTTDFMEDYELLQPFGNANPQPVFLSKYVTLDQPVFHMKNHHLKLWLCQKNSVLDAVYFGGGERKLPELPWDILFTVDRNTFRGRTQIQLSIQAIRTTE